MAVRTQHQRLIDFARQHRRHLTLVEFREYKLLHGACLDAHFGSLNTPESHPGIQIDPLLAVRRKFGLSEP